jgi:hypothetical protein
VEEKEIQKILTLKLTPLNIVCAACLVTAVMILFDNGQSLPVQKGMHALITGLCFLAVIIAFISDLIFRKFIPLLRNLWLTECAFIVFTVILMLIMKAAIT